MTVAITGTSCQKLSNGSWEITVTGSSSGMATVELLQGTTVLASTNAGPPSWVVKLIAPATATPPFTVRASISGKEPVTASPNCPP